MRPTPNIACVCDIRTRTFLRTVGRTKGVQSSRLQNKRHIQRSFITSSLSSSLSSRRLSTTTNTTSGSFASNESWSEEWKKLGLGAKLPKSQTSQITNLLFVQTGFGVDQHGNREKDGATKAAVRAVRNAIEFNSIPGVIEAVPGGREEMLIQVLLGVPPKQQKQSVEPMDVGLVDVAKVFPYGRLLPIQVVVGGLRFPTGRIVTELGDEDDNAICVVASISIGYYNGKNENQQSTDDADGPSHKIYNTKDGY